jgi:hypothetical protein
MLKRLWTLKNYHILESANWFKQIELVRSHVWAKAKRWLSAVESLSQRIPSWLQPITSTISNTSTKMVETFNLLILWKRLFLGDVIGKYILPFCYLDMRMDISIWFVQILHWIWWISWKLLWSISLQISRLVHNLSKFK